MADEGMSSNAGGDIRRSVASRIRRKTSSLSQVVGHFTEQQMGDPVSLSRTNELLDIVRLVGRRLSEGVVEEVALSALEDLVQGLDALESSLASPDASRQARAELMRPLDYLVDRLGDLSSSSSAKGSTQTLRTKLDLYRSVESATGAAADAERLRQHAAQSASHIDDIAGGEAAGELSNHFADFAQSEKTGADAFRAAAMALAGGAAAVAVILLWGLEDPSVGQVLRKGLITLPILLLAAYLAREASAHRTTYRWLKTVEVQLRTVKAYTDPLPEPTREVIQQTFGRYVFGNGPIGRTLPDEGRLVDDLAVLRQVVDLISGRSPDKPSSPAPKSS